MPTKPCPQRLRLASLAVPTSLALPQRSPPMDRSHAPLHRAHLARRAAALASLALPQRSPRTARPPRRSAPASPTAYLPGFCLRIVGVLLSVK